MARNRRLIAAASTLLLLVLIFTGAYFVRRHLLETAMTKAMEGGDSATVAELAGSFPSPVNARDEDGRTPLHRAIEWDDLALVERLLSKGAHVDAKTAEPPVIGAYRVDFQQTPLHAAAAGGRKEIVALLIAKGADVNARTAYGLTPLHLAASRGKKEAAELLITKGADVNARANIFGLTPLHEAAERGQKEMVELLIAKGADLTAKDNQGCTALQWAIDEKNDAVAEVLRKAGAKE